LLRQEYRESFSLSERALRIAIQIADREGEAASRGRLAVTAAWLADYDTALREFDAAIETYESIGHKRGLAVTETNRALPLMRVGLFNEALEAVERSNAYFHVVQEKRTIVANNVNASFITLQLGDAVKAKSFASAALADARDVGFPVFEAAALANLGNAERTLRQFSEAIAHLESGLSIRRPIQEARDFVDDLADLTLCYVGAGRYGDARATARELFAVGHDSLENAFWPHYAWWSAAQGLDAGGDLSDAVEARLRARDELRRFADRIPRRLRAGFLSIPINALIAQG
jgi:tetratricopeptide (TPR) repeat protein